MNFFDSLIIPQPDYNLNLLNVFLIIGLAIYIAYSGILFGSIILSVFFKNRSKSFNDNNSHFAIDYSNLATEKGIYSFGLGIVPMLSVIFVYMQLLHKADTSVINYLIISFLFYLIAIIVTFNYKKTYNLSKIFDAVHSKIENADIEKDENFTEIYEESKSKYNLFGNLSIIFQFISYWFFFGAIGLAINPKNWANVNFVTLLISKDSVFQFLQFISISFAITSIAFLFKNYVWDKKEIELDEYKKIAFNTNIWIAIYSIISIPLFFALGIWTLPRLSLNLPIFIASILGVILVILSLQWIYVSLKEKNYKMINYAFYSILIIVLLFAYKDKTAFAVASKEQVVVLNEEYKVHKEEFLASLGLNKVEINAEEIYTARCGACHKAEDSPVAPAHKGIMGKYLAQADPKAALVKFITNPVKVNPKYPPMPNQGLTPAEAGAVAEFMIQKYGGKVEGEKK